MTVPSGDSGRRSSSTFPAAALVAAMAVILLGVIAWHFAHRSGEPAWNQREITARFADFTVQRDHKNVHVLLRYNLANNGGKTWLMPPPNHGTLMRRLPDGNLHEVDSVQWDPVSIPAGKTAQVTFDLMLDSTKEDIPPSELRETLNTFAARHLQPIEGLVFLDYTRQDSIDLPRGWASQGPVQQSQPE